MNRLCWLGAVLLILPGCSSLIEGTTQDITVTTSPLGASCAFWRDGAVIAKVPTTPAVVTVSRIKSDILVICDKSGYQEATYLNRVMVSGAVAGNVLNAGLGWGIDSASGADNKYDRTVNLVLAPVHPVDRSSASMPGADLGLLDNSEDASLVVRFQTLQRLRDDGLITQEEYNRRRGANLGALLRYSAAPPAANLGRPAPSPEQIVDRLRYLAAAFEEKSISAREQATERGIILDALLPATSVQKAEPPPPLTTEMQAAAASGRLERLWLAKVITNDEQSREKAVVFAKVQAAMADADAAARMASGIAPPPPAPPSGPGVWLGSYHTENQARLAWASLQLTLSAELGALQPEIKKVSLRRRSVTYHLNAGPLADRKTVEALCRTLRSKRQFCRAAVLGG